MNNLSDDNNSDTSKKLNSLRNGRRVLPIVVPVDIEAPAEEQEENQIITTDKNHKDCLRKATTTVTATTASEDDSGYHLDCLDAQVVIAVLCLSGACIGILAGIVYAIFALADYIGLGDGIKGD